ncbi:MAG: hypothetical protein HYZ75_04760 [Elusimicrobia bacterium]|nr:hypothetical protein [Elusimicrobiota bacterium]
MRPLAWLDRLERSFGDWSIPNPALALVGLNAAVWALSLVKPEFPLLLTLEPARIMAGEVWRLATFLFIPPPATPFWMFFWLVLFYSFSQALENEWGEFRFSVYYGLGAAATAGLSLALGSGLSNVPLNTSLFLAFAELYPEVELMLFFVVPVKVRWLGWLAWASVLLQLLGGGWAVRLGLLAGLLNYAVFFGPDKLDLLRARLKR